MLGSIILLAFVLIPGVGHTVNGATRWLNFGLFTFQVSEIAKLFLIIYLSGYLLRRGDEVQTNTMGFIKPMLILAMASGLLLMEPDFGAAAVLLMTGLGLIFLGGVRFGQFLLFVVGYALHHGLAGGFVAVSTGPYYLIPRPLGRSVQ